METIPKFNFPDSRAPFRFGQHPRFESSFKKHRREEFRKLRKGGFYSENIVLLANIPRAGRVYLVPRDQDIEVVDEFGDVIAVGNLDKAMFPFSSYDFYADIYDDEDEYFKELRSKPFFRLGGISQLGYLVPPRPDGWEADIRIVYLVPHFAHTRWAHSRLVAFLTEVILAGNGFTEEERFPIDLTAAYHDIAIPAGGDSVKRVDIRGLDEEENFEWVLRYYGLVEKWKKYGFDIEKAKEWVKGLGLFGRLLDVVDKMAYTALDCYQIGLSQPCKIRSFGLQNPLVMDVWQDLRFNEDRSDFAFTDPDRLFRFLLFRAYEHLEVLMNPYARALDFFLQKLIQPLYKQGILTREQLLTQDDQWLHGVLRDCYPEKSVWAIIEPELLSWKKFDSFKDFKKFCAENKDTDHTEHIRGFNTGLNFGVYSGNRIVSAKESFSKEQIKELKEVNRQVKGYYVYYAKE